jgi:signal transduction histidine kinase
MTWRLRSVRKRILLLALVPVLSLFGLFVFTTSITARDALSLAHTTTVRNVTGLPAGVFLAQAEAECPLAMVYLADPTGANLTRLNLQGARTSRASGALRAVLTSSSTMDSASAPEKQAIDTLLGDMRNLPALRAQVVSRVVSRSTAFAAYNGLVADTYLMLDQAIRQETNAALVAQGLAFVRMGRSGDLLVQEDALLISDLATGSFPAAGRREFTELVGARRALVGLTIPDLDPAYRAYYTRYVNSQANAALTLLENRVISGSGPRHLPPVSPLAWQQAVGGVGAGLTRAGEQAANALVQQASNVAWSTNLRVIVTGGIGLLLVLFSIIVAILTSRSLVRELTGLRQSALTLANERLPEVVDRLALGQDVDVTAEAPDIPASSDEIGQVRDAFAAVQQTAVRAAVGQARLRQGMSEVFRNLARRSQSLLHRQLALLDAMERRARDPQELEDLFRIDHLTTRMRRHAESLIILSGHTPARGWRNPVPLVDVLRAAVSEVEDYTRIRATAAPGASLVGPAVGDVIHLIAELAENATVFSPPNTPVMIHGDTVGKGFAVEIEDRGLGLSDEHREQINALLENPPPFDPSGSDQLGLFVAGQLAKRHNIKISLRPSPYGGITAIVLIPQNLVVPEGSHATDPAGPALADGALRFKGRHAALEAGPGDISSAPVPTGAATSWDVAAIPAMRDPADTADLGAASLGSPAFPREPGLSRRVTGFGGGPPGTGAPTSGGLSGRDSAGAGLGGDLAGAGLGGDLAGAGLGGDLAGAGLGGDLDGEGLPRRVRQANLAPQLRGAAEDAATAPVGEDFWGRSPEETRSTMTAIQQGWERGRSVFEPPAPSPVASGPVASGPAASGPAAGESATAGPAAGESATEDGGTSG